MKKLSMVIFAAFCFYLTGCASTCMTMDKLITKQRQLVDGVDDADKETKRWRLGILQGYLQAEKELGCIMVRKGLD